LLLAARCGQAGIVEYLVQVSLGLGGYFFVLLVSYFM